MRRIFTRFITLRNHTVQEGVSTVFKKYILVSKNPRKMQLFFYFCFIYLFKSTQANWSCDEIITPITKYNPYRIPYDPPPCRNSTVFGVVGCKTTTLEPFFLTIGNAQQNNRLGCYIQPDEAGIVGTVEFETSTKKTPSLLCPLRKSIISLGYYATEMRLKFDIKSNIALYCETIEDYFKVFHIPSKEVDSSEKGKGPAIHCDCGKRKKILSNRIINGKYVTNIEEYPWMVSIQRLYTTNNYGHICGGSIITRLHVITAAHCVDKCERNCGGTYGVKMGTDRTDSINGTIIPVENVFRHDEYDSTFSDNDIAILELANKIPENQYMPICIPYKLLHNENEQLTALGWGDMGIPDTGKEKEQLKKTHVRLVDPAVCEKILRAFLKGRQLCSFSKHSSTACGDSGGPFMYVDPKSNAYNLVGISSTVSYLRNLMPGVQTAVHHYYDWIIEIIERGINDYDDKCNISL